MNRNHNKNVSTSGSLSFFCHSCPVGCSLPLGEAGEIGEVCTLKSQRQPGWRGLVVEH